VAKDAVREETNYREELDGVLLTFLGDEDEL